MSSLFYIYPSYNEYRIETADKESPQILIGIKNCGDSIIILIISEILYFIFPVLRSISRTHNPDQKHPQMNKLQIPHSLHIHTGNSEGKTQ